MGLGSPMKTLAYLNGFGSSDGFRDVGTKAYYPFIIIGVLWAITIIRLTNLCYVIVLVHFKLSFIIK